MVDIIYCHDYLSVLSQAIKKLLVDIGFGEEEFVVFALIHSEMATQLFFRLYFCRQSLTNPQAFSIDFNKLAQGKLEMVLVDALHYATYNIVSRLLI